jgi:hypothetical protein
MEENAFVAQGRVPRAQESSEAPTAFPAPPKTHPDPDAPQSWETVAGEINPVSALPKPLLPPQPASHPVFTIPHPAGTKLPGQRAARPSEEPDQRKTEGPVPRPGGQVAVPRDVEESSQTVRRQQAYTPPVRGEFSPPASAGIPPARPPVPGALGFGKRQEKTGSSRRPEPPLREPDEIQIHIGRIEVTAVQPAAPGAAAVKPRRSAPSLDEYLRRRDGRAG